MYCYQRFCHLFIMFAVLMSIKGCSESSQPHTPDISHETEQLFISDLERKETHQLTRYGGNKVNHDSLTDDTSTVQGRRDISPFTAHRCEADAYVYLTAIHMTRVDTICQELAEIDAAFHLALGTQYQPVEDDHNPVIDIYIFDDYAHYSRDVRDLSGLTFNPRGGFFYEADPLDPQTSSSIYTFISQSTQFSVWNLSHEYSHHLNARFIKYGPVKDTSPYLFWEEGLAEYFSKGNSNPSALRLIRAGERLPLAVIFTLTYDTIHHDIYLWGYLAMRYFIQEEKHNLFLLINALRYDNPDDYDNLLQLFADTLEEDFQRWLDDIADH